MRLSLLQHHTQATNLWTRPVPRDPTPISSTAWPCQCAPLTNTHFLTYNHRWCGRCKKYWRTQNAFRQHLLNSPHHHECNECDFDGNSWAELLDHCRRTSCFKVCQGCDDGQGMLWNQEFDGYWQHVKDENVCIKCERHYSTPGHLHQACSFVPHRVWAY